MSRFTYKITDGVLEIWDNENPNEQNAPFLRQYEWPDGTPWNNDAEIKAWAEVTIASLLDSDAQILAGPNPQNPTIPKPAPVPSPDKPQS